MTTKGISIIIPTWNGKALLQEFLPSVIESCNNYHAETELIVIDDGSIDGTSEFLHKEFPFVKLFTLFKNSGYIYASNFGIKQAKHDFVVLLNNDVWMREDFLTYLPDYFVKTDLFAVRIRVFSYEDKEAIERGDLDFPALWIRGVFKYGFIYTPAEETCLLKDALYKEYAFSVSAGAFAVNKKKWLELGGFDDLYYPFYSEETDIAYRALKRGWKIYYEPRSIVYHRGEGFTITKARKSWYINLIGERNRYFLVWKNIIDIGLFSKHILWLPLRLVANIFSARFISFFAFFYALKWVPAITKARSKEKRESRLSDKDIFSFFKLK